MSPNQLPNYLKSNLYQGKAEKRLSLKGQCVTEDIAKLKTITHLKRTSYLIKSVILKINDDILQRQEPQHLNALKKIAAVFG